MNKLTLTVLGLSLLGSLASAEEMKTAAPAKNEAPRAVQTGSAAPAKAEAPKAKPAKKAAKAKKAAAATQEAKAVYKCEHCNVTSDKPGKCSMCGMDLKKI